MNRGDLRTEVRRLLKEASAVFWSDAQLNGYLDDALLVYTSRLGLRTKEKTASAVQGQEAYVLPGDFVVPTLAALQLPPTYYVSVDGRLLQFLPVQVYSLVKTYGAGAGLGSAPVFFTYFNQGNDPVAGLVLALKLLPAPASNGTSNILIGYESKAPTMTLDTDVPNIPQEDHIALAWAAAATAFLARGQTEEAAVYQALFDRRVAERLPSPAPVAVTAAGG